MSDQITLVNGDLVVDKNATISENLIVKKNACVSSNLCVCGAVKIGSSKKVNNSLKKLDVYGKVEITGTTTFQSLPIMSKIPLEANHLVNKAYVDSKLGSHILSISSVINQGESILDKNNNWTGKNVFNSFLPTSTLKPTSGNHLTNKAYVDSLKSTSLLTTNNIWTGQNAYNTFLPTSSLLPTLSNEFTTKAYVDSLISGTSLLTSNNTWLGTNDYSILPTSNATVLVNNQLTTKEYVDNAINSHVGSMVSVSPGASSNYLTFVTGTSGNQALYVDTGITYNATTDTLTVVNANITGNCNATVSNAINANNVNVFAITSTNTNCSVLLVGNQTTGNQPVFIDTGLTYSANDDALTVSLVNGDLNGTATNANNINIRSTSSSDTTCSVVLVGNQATGNQQPFIDGGLMYNANTDNLSASSFTGNLLGDVIGRVNTNLIKVGSSNGSNISQILIGTGVLTSAGGGTNIINTGTIGLTTSSRIFVTFTLSPAGIAWFYVTPDRDQFIITASAAPTNDASFNWIAYN